MTMLSIIVPTCNRNQLLNKCLDRLKPSMQSINIKNYEVIVTDDGKESQAEKLITTNYSWVKWIKGPQKGPAANRNNGASYAAGDWLIFIDDDCLPDNNLLQEYFNLIKLHPQILAFEGKIYVDVPQSSFLQEAPINISGGFFWSCNICIKKSIFFQLKGFDEKFPNATMEDVDFYKRLKKTTSNYMFNNKAAVLHPWRINQQLFKSVLNRQKSVLYYLSKYPEERQKMSYIRYLQVFIHFLSFTLKHAWKFRFKGFGQKIITDFLQLYFALRVLLKLDN